MNFFSATLKREQNGEVMVTTKDFTLTIPVEETYRLEETYLDGEKTVTLGIRPDDIKPVDKAKSGAAIKAKVALVEELGTQTLVYANTNEAELMEENSVTAFCSSMGANCGIHAEQEVLFEVNIAKLHFFDEATEQTIKHRIPTVTVNGSVKNGILKMLGTAQALPAALKERLKAGEYKIEVPTSALKFSDKGYAGVIEEIDDLGKGRYMYRICCGEDRVFLIDDKMHSERENVCVDVAVDKLTFNCDGEEVVSAIPNSFRLNGKFMRIKEGKEKKHYIEVDGVKIETPFEFNQKMYDRGRAIFKRNLSFGVPAAKVKICGEGVPVKVDEVLDYGIKKFARLRFNETTFCIVIEGELPEQNVCIKFDFDAVKVYDRDIDMRLF